MNKLHNVGKKKEVVAIYTRVSSAEQASSGLSLDMQKEECEKWAKEHNYDIIYFEDAGKSGAKFNPNLKCMLEYARKNKLKSVVVWKLDRLSRSQEIFFGNILPALRKSNCTISSLVERFDDVFEIAPILLSIYIGQAEQELDNIKKRTKTVISNRVEKGYKLGKAPVGYLNARDEHKHGIIIPDPNKEHYIKRIYEMYATGAFSMERLGQEVAKYGFVDGKGKPYPKKRIEDILKNAVYAGKVTYGDKVYDGVHKPIVSEELFYRVQLMFNGASNKKPRGETYIYSNYIKCDKCGYTMVGTTKHGGHNSGTYIYYHCSNYKKVHKKEVNIRECLIDEAMQEVLDSFNISDIELKNVKHQIYSAISDLQSYEHKSLEELKKQYSKIVDTISNGIKKKLSGELTIDNDTFNEIHRKWQAEKDSISQQIQNLSENSKDRMTRMNILADFANRIPELYLKATLDEKRLILSTITDEILFDEDTNTLKVKLKSIFEQLRQRKLQNKQSFSADVKSLTGTLESRTEKAKQACENYTEDFSKIIDFGTRKEQIQTKKEPINKGSKKLNVDRGT